MFVQQVAILGNVAVVKIGDPKIEEDIEKECKIEYRKIKAIFAGSGHILHCTVDTKNPEWLYQQIKKKEKPEIGYKFTLHTLHPVMLAIF
jgi:hypothetical protein